MNSKELLEQAEIKTGRINVISNNIREAENILNSIFENIEVCLGNPLMRTTYIYSVVTQEVMDRLKNEITVEITKCRDTNITELEKLLGIRKPAMINPEFEAATKDMFEAVKKPEPDPVEQKLEAIIQRTEQRIKDAPVPKDKSLDKLPAEKKARKQYPDGMDVETVTRMYVDEGKTASSIAKYFNVNTKQVENFITIHKIKRQKKQAEETERP